MNITDPDGHQAAGHTPEGEAAPMTTTKPRPAPTTDDTTPATTGDTTAEIVAAAAALTAGPVEAEIVPNESAPTFTWVLVHATCGGIYPPLAEGAPCTRCHTFADTPADVVVMRPDAARIEGLAANLIDLAERPDRDRFSADAWIIAGAQGKRDWWRDHARAVTGAVLATHPAVPDPHALAVLQAAHKAMTALDDRMAAGGTPTTVDIAERNDLARTIVDVVRDWVDESSHR